MNRLSALFCTCLALLAPGCSAPDDTTPDAGVMPKHAATHSGNKSASKSDATHPVPELANQVYWGDTHLHTSDSADAFAFGARLGAEQALRFARGEEVTATSGLKAQLRRPLDFLVIADHAVGLGIGQEIYDGNPALIADPQIARWRDMLQAGGEQAQLATRQLIEGHSAGTNPPILTDPKLAGPIAFNVWQSRGKLVERYNDPDNFTAFIGYEFTPAPGGDNLHRVVIFRDGNDKTSTTMPFSSGMSEDPEDLWKALSSYEERTGGQVLAIPHNSNLSNGRMFALTDFEGAPITTDYAMRRARWEPLTEITQIKGDSESHPFLSPNDEFAAFGDKGWELGNLTMGGKKTNDMLAGDYVREALKRGFALERETGVNPFKFGLIGSTDAHTALATADSDNFFGKHTGVEPNAQRASSRAGISSSGLRIGWQFLASGYAAVWASSNTREALFDAMMRKEVYATTGPRIALRFFGGWNFVQDDAQASDIAQIGYQKGVPMGGDLSTRTGSGSPTFLLSALMDPEGANLDRVQIIKGWIEQDGTTYEHVYDVAWSDDRSVDENGKLPPVGNTVDLVVPTWTNSIGSAQLLNVWTDPDFDASMPAFYYVRVLEIPTPRWPAYDAVRFGAKIPVDAQLVHQERAYSSPIWYSPH